MNEKNDAKLNQDSDTHGMSVMGDGATIKKKPFFNVLVNKHGIPPVVKEVHDCSKHLASGGKKMRST